MIHHPVLDQLAKHGVKLGLDRVKGFLTFLGEPQRAYPVVHIAGTNGKGSTSAFVSHALMEAGYRVGTNLSPHLEAVNERIRINMVPLPDAKLIEALEAHDRVRWDWARGMRIEEVPLTYFEFLTTLAFMVFAHEGVNVAVVETGMGGRLDATNVVQPVVTAITHIGADHMPELGTTLEEVAGEKAGIFKRGVPVVLGVLPPEAKARAILHAERLGCPLWVPGKDLMKELRKGRWNLRTPEGTLTDVKLGLDGLHQGSNALVALGILHQMRKSGFHIPDEAIKAGFENTRLPGRLERLKPTLLIDGAHNEPGAEALATFLSRLPRPAYRVLLVGIGRERDPTKIVAPLLPHVDEVVTTRCAHPKALDSHELAGLLQDMDLLLADGGPIEEALPEVYRDAHETIVTGSLYLCGAVRALVGQGVLDNITPGQGQLLEAEE